MSKAEQISQLRNRLAGQLISCDHIKRPHAISTGWPELDRFFLWPGWPKGEISLIYGPEGLGPTRLWMKCLPQIIDQQLWAAWLSPKNLRLCPWDLFQQTQSGNLSRLFIVETPSDQIKDWLWVTTELLSVSLFEIIGCHWDQLSPKPAQIHKLKRLAERYQCALVILTQQEKPFKSPLYAAIVQVGKNSICIERAQHRPTPHFFQRRLFYADFMPQFKSLPTAALNDQEDKPVLFG